MICRKLTLFFAENTLSIKVHRFKYFVQSGCECITHAGQETLSQRNSEKADCETKILFYISKLTFENESSQLSRPRFKEDVQEASARRSNCVKCSSRKK